jgi:hypothetical protein
MSGDSMLADPLFTEDPMAIDESLLVARLKGFKGYGYHLTEGISYPWPLPQLSVRTGLPSPKINCCTFVEALLVKAWEDAVGTRLHWGPERHKQMMILGSDLFSPITAVVEAGMATPLELPEKDVPPWTIVQAWKDLRGKEGGHTFLIVAQRQEAVLTLEANASHRLEGVGFRGLGHAERFHFAPPPGWWEHPNLWKDGKMWTWPRIRDAYPDLKLARLKVKGLQWVQ